jgi:hypothetical protein
MTAPIASGWSDCRVGLAPTGKRRLCTAHAKSRRLARNVQGEQGLSVHQAGAGLLYDWIGPDAIDITMTLRVYDV